MATPSERPDPDALLRRVQAEERRQRTGRLKIFFGFAPGVGKTYRMLQVARELVTQGLDAVVGAVETHGRYDTASLLLGLELLPRRSLPYRGRVLEEFDLDAALARRPALLLLDELAHANAPGSRHAKRWQDALELLEAGIDVHSTLNVQHVESLNDVVEQITRVQVRETVPDSVLERADEIELVDIAPEELLQRLKDGKVYLPEQAARAVEHFFQRGNLLALRELALRRMAQRVDADVQAFREEQGVQATWPTAERILVCVGSSPGAARLVRAAARMAAGLRAPWVAATAEPTGRAPLGDQDRERLDAHLRLADSLGAETARLSGPSVAEAILAYARKHNVTRIVIGKPGRFRWREVLRGSILERVVRGSGDIEVHAISGEAEAEREPRAPGEAAPPGRARPYAWSALLVAVTTGVAVFASSVIGVPDPQMLYLLGIMLAAVWFGRGPSVLAAALSVAAYDFFMVPPAYTFAVADARYVLTFAMMFGVGLLVSSLVLQLRRAEQSAVLREERTAALHTLGRELGSALHLDAVAAVAAGRGTVTFDTAAAVLVPDGRGLAIRAASPSDFAPGAAELAVARWTLEHGQPAGSGTDTLPGAAVTCAPLRLGSQTLGVLALRPREPGPLSTDQRDFLLAFARQVAFALERVRLAEQARQSALRARTEELRSSLLSSVSHDLRTPIAAITGAASTLRGEAPLDERTRRDLLETVCEEAERLEHLVSNLLDMTRLESGTVSPKREWVPLEEVVGTALSRVEKLLGPGAVSTSIPDGFPMLSVDPALLEQLLVNLLENAARYAGGRDVEIRAEREGGSLLVEVADRGPGIPAGDEERIFERFQRGPNAGAGGAGLGLPIARAIAEVHGGRLAASNRPGGGSVFRLTLPAMEPPPLAPAELEPAGGTP